MSNFTPVNNAPLQPLIPLVYDENTSYLEFLYKVNGKLTELINYINEYGYDSIIDYVDTQIKEIKDYLEIYKQENKIYIDNVINENLNEVYNKIDLVQLSCQNYTDNEIKIVKSLILDLQTNLENQIQNIVVGNINVLNPTNGLTESLPKVLNDIYDVFRTDSLSAQEFDNLLITAQQFDNLDITAQLFDLNSKSFVVVA